MVDAQTVQGGSLTLSEPANMVQIGLPYTHKIIPLPPNEVGKVGAARKLRLIRALFRVKDTAALSLDIGRGLKDISLKQLGQDEILDVPNPLLSGDIEVRGLGWQESGTSPLWEIEQSLPLPFTLLMVSSEIKVND